MTARTPRRKNDRDAARLVLLCALLSAAIAAPVTARAELPRMEIVPFAGYRFGSDIELTDAAGTTVSLDVDESGSFGVVLDIELNREQQVEISYSQQATSVAGLGTSGTPVAFDLDVAYYQIGGKYLFPGKALRPFIAASIGATHFHPEGIAGVSGETRFSGSLGGGVKIRATPRIGFLLEGRGYGTLTDGSSSIFCAGGGGGGGCAFSYTGDALFQFEARAGLSIAFGGP